MAAGVAAAVSCGSDSGGSGSEMIFSNESAACTEAAAFSDAVRDLPRVADAIGSWVHIAPALTAAAHGTF